MKSLPEAESPEKAGNLAEVLTVGLKTGGKVGVRLVPVNW
jgi:hypothetical protein